MANILHICLSSREIKIFYLKLTNFLRGKKWDKIFLSRDSWDKNILSQTEIKIFYQTEIKIFYQTEIKMFYLKLLFWEKIRLKVEVIVEVIVEVLGVVEVMEVSLLFVEVTSFQNDKSLRVVPDSFFNHSRTERHCRLLSCLGTAKKGKWFKMANKLSQFQKW